MKKKLSYILFLLILFICQHNVWSQTNITNYTSLPSYPGGEEALFTYIDKNLKKPKKVKTLGVVYVEITIDSTGRISDKKVLRSPDKNLNDAALQVFKYMPDFYPAKREGDPYEEKLVVPVKFD